MVEEEAEGIILTVGVAVERPDDET